jgi:hypothetical protein
MAVVLISLSAVMVKRIFEHYELSPLNQLLGFAIVFLNYGVLVFSFYYPVMTDVSAFFLSVALFYFFVKGQLTNIFLTGLIGAFTFPVLFVMAVALLLFSKGDVGVTEFPKWLRYALYTLGTLSAMAACWFVIIYNNETNDMAFTLPINRSMLPVSFGVLALLFFFMPAVLCNGTFLTIDYYKKQLNGNTIFAIVTLGITFLVVRSAFQVPSSAYTSFYHQLKTNFLYAFQRPGISLVSHWNYYGAIILLLLVFWRGFANYVASFGLGVAGVVFLNLFVFSMKPESRILIYFMPWLMILMSLYLGKQRFPALFYVLILISNLALSKIWLFFDYTVENNYLTDGTIGFSNQWFFMHLGPWMTEQVWLWLCVGLIVSLPLFIVSLYKVQFGKKEILFYKKYEPLNYE